MTWYQWLIELGVVSAFITFAFTLILKKIERKEDERHKREEKREQARKKFELLEIQGTLAAMALGEATATALKNGHCNGETEGALKYEKEVKHKIEEFISEQGVDNLSK